jgi:hypothetical protein
MPDSIIQHYGGRFPQFSGSAIAAKIWTEKKSDLHHPNKRKAAFSAAFFI